MVEKYNAQPDFIAMVKDLKDRLDILERANSLVNTTIDVQTSDTFKRGMSIIDKATGNVIAFIGVDPSTLTNDGNAQARISFYRANDGTIAFEIFDKDPKDEDWVQTVALKDSQGNSIIADDVAGFGFSLPKLFYPLYPVTDAVTASASYVEIFRSAINVVQPSLYIQMLTTATGAQVGQLKLTINGVQYGDEPTFDAITPVAGWFLNISDIPYNTIADISIQMQIIAGTGTVNCRPWFMRGQGT